MKSNGKEAWARPSEREHVHLTSGHRADCGCYYFKGDSDACFALEVNRHVLTVRTLFPPFYRPMRVQSSGIAEGLTHALVQPGSNGACGRSAQTTDWAFVPKPARRMTLFERRRSWRHSGCVNQEPFPTFDVRCRRSEPLSLRGVKTPLSTARAPTPQPFHAASVSSLPSSYRTSRQTGPQATASSSTYFVEDTLLPTSVLGLNLDTVTSPFPAPCQIPNCIQCFRPPAPKHIQLSYPCPSGPSWPDPPQQPLSLQTVRAVGREHGRQLVQAAQAGGKPVTDYLATYPNAPPLANPIQNPFTSSVPRPTPTLGPVPARSLHEFTRRKRPSLLTLNSPLRNRSYTYPFALPSFNHVLGYISRPNNERDCRPATRPPPFVIPLRLPGGRSASIATAMTEASSMPATPADVHPALEQEAPSTRKERRMRSRSVQDHIYCVLCEKSFKPRKGTIDWHIEAHAARTCEYCFDTFAHRGLLERHLLNCDAKP